MSNRLDSSHAWDAGLVAIEPAVHELLERELELEMVAALFDAAGRGHGGLLLVEGSPGVGKTALIERATAIARERGLAVLRARGHELERAFGWGVARSLLELPLARHSGRDDLLAGPAAPARAILDPGAEAPETEPGFAILHALYWLVARMAESGPLLVAVDDAQWADEPSLRFLIYLAGRLSEHPIAILVGARAWEQELLAQARDRSVRHRSGHCRRSELRRWRPWCGSASRRPTTSSASAASR